MQIPKAKKILHKYNVNFYEIKDNYDWLRDRNWPNVTDKDVLGYLEEENKYTDNFFSKHTDLKTKIFEELKSRIKLTDTSAYTKKEEYFYYTRTEEDKNYPIYCRKKTSLASEEEIILNVNELSQNQKFTKLSSFSISPSQNLLAYSVDFAGNEQYTIYVKDLTTNKLLSDKIESTISQAHWHEDESGFFYTPTNDNWRHDKVKFHRLSEPVEKDQLIMHEEDLLNQLSIHKSASKKFFIIESSGHDSTEVFYFSMEDKNFTPIKLITRKEKTFYNIDHSGSYFYIHTNDKGSNFRVIRINDQNPKEQDAEEYIAHSKSGYLSSICVTSNYLIANYKRNALPEIEIHDLNSKIIKTISFPDNAYTANGFSTNFNEDDIRIGYSSLKRPDTIYSYNFESEKLDILKQLEIPCEFDPDEYEVERIYAENEGVKIPVSIFYKKSLFKKNGTNPCYLYGYGSYGYAILPSFRNTAITLADKGFVFAIAHIRGGDDFGYEWYESAKFLNKKRTFEDFISSSKFLIDEKYTSKGNIVICGGSAGGLLIGYAINNAPSLYKAAIAHVPFVDVINTMLDETLPLTPGEFKEWGNPKEKEYFDYMLSYSPYDNVASQSYPSLYITAGLSDPRVTYWEAAKWVAKLREHKTDNNLLLFKINMSAGHAGASGRFDYLKEVAEDYVFIFSMFEIV